MNPAETEQARVHYVKITNSLDVPFTDMYDGVPIRIMPGKSENIPLDMAAHFFGYHYGVEPEVMFRHVAKRQGWNTPEYVKQNPVTHKTLAREYFDKLQIAPVVYKLVQVDPDPREPVPAEPAMREDDDAPEAPRRGRGRPPKVNSEASA